ncbi:myb/SANT-like DNA-binding domain-containing protein 4 [Lineus longissimus]|uniref:myb/SANT-like DNA-binding domain-containing protein 4 n=1 Tax=Lineus longissimus TaxID=88925 RepID=UPI00315C8E3F
MSREKSKSSRSSNVLPGEVDLLIDKIVENYKIISCKFTDSKTNDKKNQAWAYITKFMNSRSTISRTEDQWKRKWGDVKGKVKTKATQAATLLKKTGTVLVVEDEISDISLSPPPFDRKRFRRSPSPRPRQSPLRKSAKQPLKNVVQTKLVHPRRIPAAAGSAAPGRNEHTDAQLDELPDIIHPRKGRNPSCSEASRSIDVDFAIGERKSSVGELEMEQLQLEKDKLAVYKERLEIEKEKLQMKRCNGAEAEIGK